MKIIYSVDSGSFHSKDHLGVQKKVYSQIRLMEKNGFDVTLQCYTWENGYPQLKIQTDTDVIYFRRIESSVKFLWKLRELKRINPSLKIMMEIPTYPFKNENKERMPLKRILNQTLATPLLRFYIDRIVLCGQKDKIPRLYGIPVIHFNNGIDYNEISMVSPPPTKDDAINMICVSGCYLWHAYDRMIKGLKEYYDTVPSPRQINFHIVGDGEYYGQYKELATQYNLLDKSVFIYGRKTGAELDAIYNKCDLAINHLGAHRIQMDYLSTLKSNEYAARGLPIVSGVMIDICHDETKKYILFVPADETPIDIPKIIEFYDSIYLNNNKQDTIQEIRNTFYAYCDWTNTYQNVINYLCSLK